METNTQNMNSSSRNISSNSNNNNSSSISPSNDKKRKREEEDVDGNARPLKQKGLLAPVPSLENLKPSHEKVDTKFLDQVNAKLLANTQKKKTVSSSSSEESNQDEEVNKKILFEEANHSKEEEGENEEIEDNNVSTSSLSDEDTRDLEADFQPRIPVSKQWSSVRDVGISSDPNLFYRHEMEDDHVAIDCFGNDPNRGYFAVYDGHGGRDVVDLVKDQLHQIVLEEVKKSSTDIGQAFTNAYRSMDQEIGKTVKHSGSTSVSALVIKNSNGERILHVANAGDARAVLCTKDGKAIRLSYDHKGSDENEKKRIIEGGGFVVMNRVDGILAVTRSLGDFNMKKSVIPDPFLTETKIEDDKGCILILACDGLWDVVSDEEACKIIQSETSAQSMSDKLLHTALENGTRDNVTIMVIIL